MPNDKLQTIDILVYPFYAGGAEIINPHGRQKYEQWMKEIDEIIKNKKRALIVVHLNSPDRNEIDIRVRYLFDSFEKKLSLLKRTGRVFEDAHANNLRTSIDSFNQLKKHGFGKNVSFRCYGQHAKACVKTAGVGIAMRFMHELISQKLVSPNNIQVKEIGRLSVKYRETYAAQISTKINPKTRKVLQGLSIKEAQEFLNHIENYPEPFRRRMLFMIRKPTKVRAALKKVKNPNHL